MILNIGNYSVCTPATQLMLMGDEGRTTRVCTPATQLMFMGDEERTTSVRTPATQLMFIGYEERTTSVCTHTTQLCLQQCTCCIQYDVECSRDRNCM